ncbi:energy-coupling factor transporter transmembrane component T family protein [Corynebacterium auriscanis]|uniref:energy-coupling factor transporter transmembrane component T family protein n=1 Tax=Corynebacterium auriscanis TaxID=99807 RepID=UPI0024ADACC9|nr:energy-coupling factor transporter transmembrane component T [Corynebacterium auriscanis]
MFNPHVVPMGVYVPGRSVVHTAPTGLKLSVVIVTVIITAVLGRWWPVALGGLLLVVVLYVLAHIPAAIVGRQMLAPVPVVAFIGAVTWWRESWEIALCTTTTLFTAIAIAILLTLTTTVEQLMDALERLLQPLTRRGFPTEKILIAMSLTMRLIPLTAMTVAEILEARRARGLGFSPTAFGVPLLVRSLLRARAFGEALISRGIGD